MKFFAAVAALVLTVMPISAAYAAPTPDPALQQTVSANETLASGQAEIPRGHVDIGPLMVDGKLTVALRDDTVKPATWRRLDDVVLRVNDSALLEIPADPQYQFLGIAGGKKVHVVPQTQASDVVWVGWNTQHPSITSLLKRGATLRYHKVEGPGALHVFLQNGFDKPQPLWSSSQHHTQDIWVDLNTHTHANWVFSEPGNYQVQFEVRAEGVDGKPLTAGAVVKFAVGGQASAAELFGATMTAVPSATASPVSSAAPSQAATQAVPAWIWGAIAGAGVLAVGLLVVWWIRRQRQLAQERRAIFEESGRE